MKRVLLALVGAFTIISNGSAYAADPFSFGIKGGFVNSMILGLGKTGHKDTAETSTFNPGANVAIYGEYAFHENVGFGLEGSYTYGTVAKLVNKDGKKHVTLDAQKISMVPSVIFYPMGREDEDGILKLFVGGDLSVLPLKASISSTETGRTADDIKKDITPLGIGAVAGVGYEFPFGLVLDFRTGYSFTDLFIKDATSKKNNLNITNETNLLATTLSVGYNFGVLLEERI